MPRRAPRGGPNQPRPQQPGPVAGAIASLGDDKTCGRLKYCSTPTRPSRSDRYVRLLAEARSSDAHVSVIARRLVDKPLRLYASAAINPSHLVRSAACGVPAARIPAFGCDPSCDAHSKASLRPSAPAPLRGQGLLARAGQVADTQARHRREGRSANGIEPNAPDVEPRPRLRRRSYGWNRPSALCDTHTRNLAWG